MSGSTITIFCLIFLIGSINNAAGRTRVIGGHDAHIKQFPYLVSLRIFGEHFCGGTIISERHILTAGHCMEDTTLFKYIKIHSGISKSNERGTVHKVEHVFTHPDYDKDDPDIFNDISIITLKDPIVFNKYTHKVKIPEHNVHANQTGYVIGWGRYTKENWDASKQLQKLRVAMLPSDECQKFVPDKLGKGQVCTFRSVGTGPCHGDSGGPLIYHDEVVGIASYVVEGNCAAGYPSVYTNVFAYKDFIESAMKS